MTSGALWTPSFVTLGIAELAYFIAAAMMIPVVPLFASGPLDAGPAGVGLAVGALSVAGVLLRLFAGREVDRRGRRPLLVGGALLFAAATALLTLAETLPVLVALRLLQGAGEAAFFVASFALLADLAPADRFGEAVSFISLGLYGGIAIGPLLGEVLVEQGGFHAAWWGATALAATAAALASRLPEPAREPPAQDQRARLVHPAALGPGVGMFAAVSAMAGFLAFVALRAEELDMAGARYVLVLYGGIVIACRILFATLPDRVEPLRLMSAALTASAAGLATAAAVDGPAGLYAGAALVALGVAFTTPAFFAAVMSRVTPSERGAASGTASLFIDLGFGAGPILLGLAVDAAGIPAGFAVGAALAALGAAWTLSRARLG